MITADQARALLAYEPETGVLSWRVKMSRRVLAGDRAGWFAKRPNGSVYRQVEVPGQVLWEHRLIWLIVAGEWPSALVDHINRDGSDNRWINLRLASAQQSCFNTSNRSDNKSGFVGVHWHAGAKKWRSQITISGKCKHLGFFDTPEAAHEAYRSAARLSHGTFVRVEFGPEAKTLAATGAAA